MFKKLPAFQGNKGFNTYSQQPTAEISPELDEPSPHT